MVYWETELSGVKLADIASRFIVLYKLYKSQKWLLHFTLTY